MNMKFHQHYDGVFYYSQMLLQGASWHSCQQHGVPTHNHFFAIKRHTSHLANRQSSTKCHGSRANIRRTCLKTRVPGPTQTYGHLAYLPADDAAWSDNIPDNANVCILRLDFKSPDCVDMEQLKGKCQLPFPDMLLAEKCKVT